MSSTLYIGGGNTATYVHAYKHFPDILGLCSCSDEALPDEREFEVLPEETLEGENISDRSQQWFVFTVISYCFNIVGGATEPPNRKRKASSTDTLEKEAKKFKEDSPNSTILV